MFIIKENMKEIYEVVLFIMLVYFIITPLKTKDIKCIIYIIANIAIPVKTKDIKFIIYIIANIAIPVMIFSLFISEPDTSWKTSAIIAVIYLCLVMCNKKRILKRTCEIGDRDKFKNHKYSIYGFEYDYTDHIKSMVKKNKSSDEEVKQNLYNLIKKFNLCNLVISIIMFGLVWIIKCICNEVHIFILFAIFLRCFSRGMEITVAFYTDIIDSKNKSSGLEASDRIELATKSLVEITLLFAAFYMYWSGVMDSIIYSIGVSTLLDVNLTYEVNPIEVNKSYIENEKGELFVFPYLRKIMATFQVVVAAVLIVLSLARYIGDVKSKE